MDDNVKVENIEIGEFKVILIESDVLRLEAKLIFDRSDISQKLVFRLMEISHNYGFGCTPPVFYDDQMAFLVGTIITSRRSLNKFLKRMEYCLLDLKEFVEFFKKQIDLSSIDLSMFDKIRNIEFYPEFFSAIRDQYYEGSWEKFYDDMVNKNHTLEASVIECLIEFEIINKKDIGYISTKLGKIIDMVNKESSIMN